ncbi:retrovirus-related pol polyprotein from transposon TNT 1-94, partial [Tanacetum coccineum]
EPKKVIHALKDPSWIEAIQEELLQIKLQEVWTLVDLPNDKKSYKVHTQEEGSDYDEVFALVARIEAIRLFLAYASFKDFMVYQIDVKSAFLYGKIEEEVYVCQPPRFEDLDFPDRVYKVKKALYRLHQALRVWYETLSTYLLDNGFQRGKIDKTLFINRDKGDILLVQVYMDDIIFGLTKKELCIAFEKLRFIEVKTAGTPMETQKPLLKDKDGKEVDVYMYRSMIGSLMYLTSSRPDIKFAVCAYARYQVNQKVSHLHAVKRIFRYLKGQPRLGLWYPKDSPFDLVAYTNSDYTRESLDRKSTTRGCQFLGCRLISWQCKKQTVVANSTIEAEYVVASSCCRQDKQRKDDGNDVWNGIGVNAGDSKLMLLGITTAELLLFWSTGKLKTINGEAQLHALVDGKKDSGNINKTQSKATPNEFGSQGTNSGGGPMCQETMRDTTAQTRSESVSKLSNDLLLARGNTLQSDEDNMKLNELMTLCTNLQNRLLDLDKTKTTQQNKIASLERRVKKLERRKRLRSHRLKRLYKVGLTARVESFDEKSLSEDVSKQGRIDVIDADDDITLASAHNVNVLDDMEITATTVSAASAATTISAATTVSAAPTTTVAASTTVEEITLAQALEKMKSIKPKQKVVVMQELSDSTRIKTSQQSQGKGKAIMIEHVKLKKKDQIRLDEETTLRLQVEFDEEERLAREEARKEEEANIDLIET